MKLKLFFVSLFCALSMMTADAKAPMCLKTECHFMASSPVLTELMPASASGRDCFYIADLSGKTNIRNKPNGKVCMRLWEWTQYEIYTCGYRNGWYQISSIYNCKKGYWVRLHSSSTGTYWIAASVLC